MAGEPKPVWAITLRGISLPVHGFPGRSEEDSRRVVVEGGSGVIHNIVDAKTGKWLGANTAPASLTALTSPNVPPPFPFPPNPTVTLELLSPQGGLSVPRGEIVEWTITATVSADDNHGLSMISVDLVQGLSNPALFDMPPGNRPVALQDFDRPKGVSNPAPTTYGSAYGGTQVGVSGAMNLAQIGGAQNTSGAAGNGIGSDTQVNSGIGQDQGPGGQAIAQIIATGAFLAPCTPGAYVFSIDSALANVLEQVNQAQQYSPARSAEVLYNEVQGGCGNCDVAHGGLGCSDPLCQDIVCLIDPFCCSVAWDQVCANEALQHCDCEALYSPFDFNVTGAPVCPLDIAGPNGGAEDGKIAINDFLELLAFWGFDDVDADFIAPLGVGKEDLDLLLYYWGACPCTGLPPPPPLQYEMTCRGMDWPNDWNTFMECVTNGTPDEQSSCACWLKHYLEQECEVPPGIEMGMMAPGVTPPPPCPGDDPFGIQPSPG